MNELEIFSLDELNVLSSVENFLRNIQIHLKILRLDFLRSNLKSNLAKFANFTHRDPHLENVNLKTCGATAPDKTAHSAATSHVQWGYRGFLRRCASSCKQTGAGLLLAVASA